MHARSNAGGGSPSSGKGNTKWAYFRNESGIRVRNSRGQVITVSPTDYANYAPAYKKSLTVLGHIKAKGGLWIRHGSPRWDKEKALGRVPVRMVKTPSSRGKPPVAPGDPKFTNWLQSGNKNTPGRDASRTGAAGDGSRSGEDVTHSKGGMDFRKRDRNGNPPKGPGDKPPGGGDGKLMAKLMGMMGKPGTGQMIPRKYADALAGMQYDAQIHDLNMQLARQPVQAQQDLADVGGFYGRAQDLNQQAGDRNHALAGQLANQQSNVAGDLMSALGGSANGGNAMLAASGNDANAFLSALGANESQYRNDMSPLIQQGAADAKTNLIHQGTQQHQDLALQIADLMGQRGQAKTKAIMDIIQANNALSQTRFGNRLSQMQAAAGIQSIVPDLKLKKAQLQGQNIHNAADAQTVQANGQGGRPDLSSLNPYDQTKLMSAWITNPDGTAANYKTALKRMRASGYHTHFAERLLHTYV